MKSKEIENLRKQVLVGGNSKEKEVSKMSGSSPKTSKRSFARSNSIAGSSHLSHESTAFHRSYSSRSIWSSLQENSVDFGIFNEIISQVIHVDLIYKTKYN